MGLPNWWRSLAYATARSGVPAAWPTCSAAVRTAPSRATGCWSGSASGSPAGSSGDCQTGVSGSRGGRALSRGGVAGSCAIDGSPAPAREEERCVERGKVLHQRMAGPSLLRHRPTLAPALGRAGNQPVARRPRRCPPAGRGQGPGRAPRRPPRPRPGRGPRRRRFGQAQAEDAGLGPGRQPARRRRGRPSPARTLEGNGPGTGGRPRPASVWASPQLGRRRAEGRIGSASSGGRGCARPRCCAGSARCPRRW